MKKNNKFLLKKENYKLNYLNDIPNVKFTVEIKGNYPYSKKDY